MKIRLLFNHGLLRNSRNMEVTIKIFFFVSMFFARNNLELAAADCSGRCELSKLSHHETGIKNRAMMGHSFRNFTLPKTYDCHVKCFDEKCRCQAFQISGQRCELLDEDRMSAPDDFVRKDGYAYFDMSREYVDQISVGSACSEKPCTNQCCSPNPCFYGGTCKVLCNHPKHKFKCICTGEYFGRFCQKRRARSCKEQLEMHTTASSGVYALFDPTDHSIYKTFCDFKSENTSVWTLVESFSMANKCEFANKPFYVDNPDNKKAFSWNNFRLTLSRMDMIANHSTHFRATCNFNTDGLIYIDYLRAKFTDIDLMKLKFDGCKKYEYINIRGFGCENCTAHFVQQDQWHAHVDSYYGSLRECQLKSPLTGAVQLPEGEDNFGYYKTVNHVHRCSSRRDSTTQWWFGEQLE